MTDKRILPAKFLFVFGAPKTCTTTIMGILNLHPKIFVMNECFPRKKIKHGDKYYKYYNAMPYDFMEQHKTVTKSFIKLYNFINKKSKRKYEYFGDKWAFLESPNVVSNWIDEVKEHHLIFTVRDIRDWLPKQADFFHKSCDANMYYSAIDYVYYFVKSFEHKHCLRIRLEDFIKDNTNIIREIETYLQCDISKYSDSWWAKMGKYTDINKNIFKWWIGPNGISKPSSFVKPEYNDVAASIKSNYLWDTVLPIFDKYFNNASGIFDAEEIQKDLNVLMHARTQDKYFSLNDCYNNFSVNNIMK